MANVPQVLKDALTVLADDDASTEQRNAAYTTLQRDCRNKRTLNRVLAWIFTAGVASKGAAVLILCAADRFTLHRHRDGYKQLWEQMCSLHVRLLEVVTGPNTDAGLAMFARMLGKCLDPLRGGGRLIGAVHFKRGIMNGPGVDQLPADILADLLEVALKRREPGSHSTKQLAKYNDHWMFGTDQEFVTGERDKGYIRPSVRNIMLTLGLSQLFLAKNMQKQAEKLLYVVEVAAIEFGSYTKFMPPHLRQVSAESRLEEAQRAKGPHEFSMMLLKQILGDEVSSLPEMGDVAGQEQRERELHQAWGHWTEQYPDLAAMGEQLGAALVASANAAFQAAAAPAAGAGAHPPTAAGQLPLQLALTQGQQLPNWLVGSAGSSAAGSSSAGMAMQQLPSAAAASSSGGGSSGGGSSSNHRAGGAVAGGAAVAQGAPGTLMAPPQPAAAPQVPHLGAVAQAGQQAGQQVPAQQQLTMKQATDRMVDELMRIAMGPPAAEGPVGMGADAAVGGPVPMDE